MVAGTDPLRSLYLATGVFMAPGTMGVLTRLNAQMNRLEVSTHAVARNMAIIRGQTTMLASAANQVTSAYTRQTTALARNAQAQHVLMNRNRGTRSGLVTQAVGLGTGFAALNFARQGVNTGAATQRQALLASFASQGALTRRQALRETSGLSREFRMRPTEAASLLREVQQLGLPGGAPTNLALSQAAAGFTVLNPEVSSHDAAAGLGRLIRSTTTSEDEFIQGALAAERYASAIQLAGINSAAGAGAVFDMVRELQPLNQIMKLGAGGTITLAAAFGDLNEEQRELFRGALTRMALQGKIDPDNPVASLLAISQQLQAAGTFQQKVDILKGLGFDNIRDVQTLSVIAIQMERIGKLLPLINDELHGTGQTMLGAQTRAALRDAQGSLDGIGAGLDRIKSAAVTGAAPALALVASSLEGIAEVLEQHPLLAAFLFGGTALFGITSLMRFSGVGRLLKGGGGAIAGRFMGGASRVGGFAGPAGGGRNALRSLPGLGGGIFGLFGGQSGASVAGRLAAGAGGRLALGATGVGAVLLTLGLLAPLMSRLGNELDRLGDRGGILGFIFESLGAALKILGAIGNLVNVVFGGIWKWLTKIYDTLGLDTLFTKLGQGAEFVGNLFEEDKGGRKTAPSIPGAPTTVVNVNVQSGNANAAWTAALQRAAVNTARSPVQTSSGGVFT